MLLNSQCSRPFLNLCPPFTLFGYLVGSHCLGTDFQKWPVDIDGLNLIARCADQGGR
jgi:hypothetical protein